MVVEKESIAEHLEEARGTIECARLSLKHLHHQLRHIVPLTQGIHKVSVE